MPLIDDTPFTILDVFNEVSGTLNDLGLRWYTTTDISNSIQDQYNKLVALLCPIEVSTLFPLTNSPYYNLASQISNFMYISGIYNPQINIWLQGCTYKSFQSNAQTNMSEGSPRYFNIVDMKRVLIWPFLRNPSGVLYLIYKAKAPTIANNHIPILPHSVGSQLLEYSTIADLLEQAREFKKASSWWLKLYKPIFPSTKSIFEQAKQEIKALARYDRELVLEPYRWLFHGGVNGVTSMAYINNETPSGTINGTNPTFTIAQVPNPSGSLLLTRNGQVMVSGEGYTLAGRIITFLTGFIPTTDDVLRAWYQV